ncbi:hypothetical protein PR202_ga31315 [Eleusine coracana subsp. coracana]|uniref:Palmitoyltransferase n=1 Tax=Eleusine coracana subsp. coracana TaxID=191504 RepID=A0AAV5DQP6_ELECO|nr:hypothetical protein PR202_ga31315 [Eleusine coracana subsp. coracana]
MYRSAGVAMAWNVFRFCTALKGLGSIMILLVLSIVGVTYYAVVLCNYGPALLTGGATTLAALAVLLLFHFLLAMLLWSYFSVVFTDPGSVPPNWNLDFDVETGETAPLASSEFNGQMNSHNLWPMAVREIQGLGTAYEKKTTPHWIYDLGRKRNFAQVFGNDRRYWFIPAYSEEDLRRIPALQGLDYPVRPDFAGQEL